MLGGLIPLVLLGRKELRAQRPMLLLAALLAAGGVVLNRVNVVLLAMHPRGPMPWKAASSYTPSLVEWGISVGLIAATLFLFGLGARRLPLLPKATPGDAHA